MVIPLLLVAALLPLSASRPLPNHHIQTGFKVTLKHVDSGANLTRFELFQRSVKRGNKRIQRLHAMSLTTSDSGINSPIHSGNGEFLMELSIGTPPEPYSAILDTGSDLIWTQCKPCKRCFNQPSPVFDPTKSSSFSELSCSSDLCGSLPTSDCSVGNCEYLYTYGDSSSTQGIMATETLTFGKVSIPGVGFGCGLVNDGSGFSQGSGLVGLGRGPLSLVSQLNEPKFSYCLTPIDSNEHSTLLMGSLASLNTSQQDSVVTTPLIKNPSSPSFYYVSLEGITVGNTVLPIKKTVFSLNTDGSGGMIVDSGTTITYLEESAFELVKKEFTRQVKLPVEDSNDTALDLCFKLPSSGSGDHEIDLPKLVFHFDGADLELPGENYIIVDPSGVACLAMGASTGMSIFGNFQQQNMQVLHDLNQETLSFIPTNCDQL